MFDVGCVLTFRGELYLLVGDLASAEVDARTLHEIAAGYGWPLGEGFAAAVLGEVLIDRGELAEAERLLTAGTFAGPAGRCRTCTRTCGCSSPAAGCGSRRAASRRRSRSCARPAAGALDIDHVNPAVVPWRSRLAQRAARPRPVTPRPAGSPPRSSSARAASARRARSASRCGAAARWAATRRSGCCARPWPCSTARAAQLERARAHADLGAALRRAGDLDGGARAAARARSTSPTAAAPPRSRTRRSPSCARPARGRAGGATTGVEALTPSERRIAELAAAGQQNREIAEALFVTTATVEYHLRNAYRKLGITSRTELADALAGLKPSRSHQSPSPSRSEDALVPTDPG